MSAHLSESADADKTVDVGRLEGVGRPVAAATAADEAHFDNVPTLSPMHFQLGGVLGQGGLGRVMQAHDRRLNRTVAIKELITSNDRARARFIREARVCAQLQHPSIVPVYEAGRWPTGELFYTMRMISGRSLKELIAEKTTLEERLALLPNLIAVADAMAYAHGHHVVHRDLKPSNIMIGNFGETLVIDWGLAKDTTLHDLESGIDVAASATDYELPQCSQELTRAGAVMGTPTYMPPEQARGEQVDARADVYALGAVLYHLLVGSPPYLGTSWNDVLTQVIAGPPRPLTTRQDDAPRDLVTIVHKAMERDRDARYPTAAQLVDDLRRFQTGQLVSARDYSSVTLLVRWFARHRTLLAATALVLLAAMGITAYSFGKINAARKVAELERDRADQRTQELMLFQARTSLERDPTATLAWLKQLVPRSSSPEPLRGLRDLALDAVGRAFARHVFPRDESKVTRAVFSPNGRLIAAPGLGHRVRVWDAVSGERISETPYTGRIELIAFSPDNRTVAFRETTAKAITLWDLMSGQVRQLPHAAPYDVSLGFSPDGQWLIAGTSGSQLVVWSMSGGAGQTIDGYEGHWEAVCFSSDGRWIAFAGEQQTVRLVELASGRHRSPLVGHTARVRGVAFLPGDQKLVSASEDGSVFVWDLASGTSRKLASASGRLQEMAVASNGHALVTGNLDGTVWLWRLGPGNAPPRLLGQHKGTLHWLTFSPNAQWVASAGDDAVVRLWNIDDGDVWLLQGHGGPVYHVAFSFDGRLMSTVSDDNTVRIWEVPWSRGRVLRGHEDDIFTINYSPDGRYLASADSTGGLRLWNLEQNDVRVLVGHHATLRHVSFSPDGRYLASGDHAGQVRLWDTSTGTTRWLLDHRGLYDLVFSPDGQLLATAGQDGAVRLWEVASAAPRRMLYDNGGEVNTLAFSPDGRWLALGSSDHLIRLREVSGNGIRVLRGHRGTIERLIYSVDGRHVASTAHDGTVRIWNVADGQGRVIEEVGVVPKAIAFSPDGRLLAVGQSDGVVHVYDVNRGTKKELISDPHYVSAVAFSPGGELLASADWRGAVRIWDLATQSCRVLYRHEGYATAIAFSPDGTRLASASVDRTVRLWRTTPSILVPTTRDELRQWLAHVSTAVILPSGQLKTGDEPQTIAAPDARR